MGMTKNSNTNVLENKISYGGTMIEKQPFAFDQVQFTFEHQTPYVISTEATRKIGVSHWGNIQVDEHFRIENIGPKVKGQFSRYDMDYMKGGESCLKNLESEYPYYVKNMYVGDYIGNISTTNAIRAATAV